MFQSDIIQSSCIFSYAKSTQVSSEASDYIHTYITQVINDDLGYHSI